jgi:2-polyprenyl-3-methyl-5-hydroxy-6-metoxy-1,4-benzoquinol methylase
MTTKDSVKWDKLHTAQEEQAAPSAFLKQLFELESWRVQSGKALDVAAGKGRNALFLAEKGFGVEAVDISEVGLQEARLRAEKKGLAITFRQADLDKAELPEASYDLILNINFLQRSLIPKMKRALKVGGHIIFDTYLVDQRVIGHPRNPDYLLGHNELLELFRDFRILYYREGRCVDGEVMSFRAGVLGQRVR